MENSTEKSNFVDEMLGKVKGTIAGILRTVADTIEKDIDMKWVLIGLAVLFFWNKNKKK